MKKKLNYMILVTAMIFLITAVLITSFQFAIYGDSEYRFYEKEYEKYQVTEELGMEMADVMEVTEYMMGYLIGEEEELSIQTAVDGNPRDFFNEQDRLHMADVRNLFLGGLKLRWILLGVFALLMILCAVLKGDLKRKIPGAYFTALGIMGGITVILGCLFASDFTRYFTIFHEIFFTNDLWMFDPAADLMIRMLPEGFFYDMVMRIGVIFLGSLLILAALCAVWRYRMKKSDEKEEVKI